MQSLWVKSGLAGIACFVCYFLAIVIPWPESQLGTSTSLLVVSAFPILGIVFVYGLQSALAAEKESAANQLGFVFAVGAGIRETTGGLDEATAAALRRGLRLIDLGLDVAWDFLMGTAMICWGVAMRRRGAFGPWWGVPLAVLGAALIVLNAASFPWPPGSHGLVDLGPLAGLFFAGMAVRLVLLGRASAGR